MTRQLPLLRITALVIAACATLACQGEVNQKSAPQSDLSTCMGEPSPDIANSVCLRVAQDLTLNADDRAQAYTAAGYFELDKSHFDQAKQHFEYSLKLNPNSALAYAGRGIVGFQNGDYDQAFADAKQAIKIDPAASAAAYIVAGTLADRDGDHSARIAYFNKGIELAPDSAEAYSGRANGYMRLKKYDQALVDFNKAITLNARLLEQLRPNFWIIYTQRGEDALKNGNYQAAVGDFTKAIATSSEPRAAAKSYQERGSANLMLNFLDAAIADLSKAIDLDPTRYDSFSARGTAYFKSGKINESISDLSKSIKLNEQVASSYFVRGEAYLGKSDRKSALNDFEKALTLASPDDPARANILLAIEIAKK